jgi:hypothetical protein
VLAVAELEVAPIIALNKVLQQRILPKMPASRANVGITLELHGSFAGGARFRLVRVLLSVPVDHAAKCNSLYSGENVRNRTVFEGIAGDLGPGDSRVKAGEGA